MARTESNLAQILGRTIKWLVVVTLVPLGLGLLQGLLKELETASASGATFRQLALWGFWSYLGVHLVLLRPVPLFQASHRLFSLLAVSLFGGQVTTVEGATESTGTGKSRRGKTARNGVSAEGSPLVAFSPYVVPLYLILVCAAGFFLRQGIARAFVDVPISFSLGMTAAFHWLMSLDHLQEQRSHWPLEVYLMAIGLVFTATLLIGSACIPWAIPEFSFIRALSDGLSRAQKTYGVLIHVLFH